MKAFFDKIEKLSSAFGDPEYLHLLLEPVFIYGVGFGVMIYLLSLFLKDPRLQIVALIVIAGSALVILPYQRSREAASERITQVYKIDQPSRAAGFTANTKEWDGKRWVYLLLAGLACAAIFVGPQRNRLGLGLAVGSVLVGSWVIVLSTWMHYQDALVDHPNLKTNRSPVRERVEASDRATPPAPVAKPVNISPASTTPTTRKIRPLDTADVR